MASTVNEVPTVNAAPISAESVASSSTTVEEPRAEAGPLPLKRGELGYKEEIHGQQSEPVPEAAPLPVRHPADREPSPATTTDNNPASNDTSSTSSVCKSKRLLAFFKRKKAPSFGGVTLATIVAFLLQLCLVAGTITAWALCIKYIMHPKDSDNNNDTNSGLSNTSSLIFIHVVFGIALLAQLLFLERRLYRMRAERYAYLHSGEMLPTSRSRRDDNPSIAFSPWNRPPLPTYAAALAQSGVGTGDVEDHLIAAPPPPAYGNTRGSRLLLTGFLNQQQRVQRPASVHTQMSQWEDISRPVSYMSHDSEWEVIRDARRSMQLEATLARLDRPSSRT